MVGATSDKTFEEDVLNSDRPVLVDFWAEWCRPCKALSPIIDEVANDMEGKLSVFKVNIDENPDTPAKYNVRGIPTLVLFVNGDAVSTKVGSLPKGSIVEWVESTIS